MLTSLLQQIWKLLDRDPGVNRLRILRVPDRKHWIEHIRQHCLLNTVHIWCVFTWICGHPSSLGPFLLPPPLFLTEPTTCFCYAILKLRSNLMRLRLLTKFPCGTVQILAGRCSAITNATFFKEQGLKLRLMFCVKYITGTGIAYLNVARKILIPVAIILFSILDLEEQVTSWK
jgi:hypothetical protein